MFILFYVIFDRMMKREAGARRTTVKNLELMTKLEALETARKEDSEQIHRLVTLVEQLYLVQKGINFD